MKWQWSALGTDAYLPALGGLAIVGADRLVFCGDSITDQGFAPLYGGTGWCTLIQAWLLARGIGPTFTNAGNPGFTTADLRTIVAAQVTPANPTHCFIMSGVNDAFESVTPAQYEADMNGLIGDILAGTPACVPVLLTGHLRGELPNGSNPDDSVMNDYRTRLRAIAVAGGYPYVDTRQAFNLVDGEPIPYVNSGWATQDGAHLNARGQELMACDVYGVIT